MLLQLVGLLGSALGGGAAGTAGRAVVQGVSGSVLWCWTAYVLLVGRVAWRRLLPGAVVTSLAILVYTGGSSVVRPRFVANSAIQLGTLGLVLAATTWLIGFAFVIVVAAVVGRVLAEDERVHQSLSSFLPGRRRRRSGEQLDHQQRDQGAAEHDERERPSRVSSQDVDE
jgi:membrane protein